ncbi:NmrA family NAD(P)-binding protein [Dyadobacter aurulentus]|uniref:NmrA family NAD(P)-binding protein n=1 Tax=Dyadobacter sp. UC 10 TaxID=2605428 RepID=UPI0011F28EE9|nr:NmrA family NAD(P)-binding protein [Dyadobacter sp. UC 10]KAA0992403.1 NAD(P)H-binding protein [Dyadobacter sp. UC 10]
MYIILGATGHVGTAVAETLLARGEEVTVITRNAGKSDDWQQKGAKVAVADIRDVEGFRQILQKGKRLFFLNPPAPPTSDTIAEERKNMHAIVSALEGSGLEKIVAQSTYGAQDKDGIGDLGVLYEMEQALAKTNIPTTILRGAYYMSNWDVFLESAREEQKIYTLYPADFKIAMVAPEDIGRFAAHLLTEAVEKTGLHHIEGPAVYAPADVAEAFSQVLGKKVDTVVIPRNEWVSYLTKMGFSQKAAESMAAMTAVTLDEKYDLGSAPERGQTTIRAYIKKLVKATT